MELKPGMGGVVREVRWAAMGSYCTPRVVYIAFVYFSEKPPGSVLYIISHKNLTIHTKATTELFSARPTYCTLTPLRADDIDPLRADDIDTRTWYGTASSGRRTWYIVG